MIEGVAAQAIRRAAPEQFRVLASPGNSLSSRKLDAESGQPFALVIGEPLKKSSSAARGDGGALQIGNR
jgi:hypothetical protein